MELIKKLDELIFGGDAASHEAVCFLTGNIQTSDIPRREGRSLVDHICRDDFSGG
jgi:hypothetical protein